ncbi:MAG: phage terminase large subunit [Porticoccaceae bacterium]
MRIKCLNKFRPLLERPKRVKILVGGRGSTKSTFAADYVLSCMAQGQLWCCAREFQNSIDESVHRLLEDEIERCGFPGFASSKTDLRHDSGGRNFYKGLARNAHSLKSMLSGVDGLWIEEGETLSDNTLRLLTASVRVSAKDAELLIAGEEFKMPEIWITMNRGSSADPVAQKWLKRAEPALERCGFYEDDMVMVVEVNFTDMPRSWFLASGLEEERLDDLKNMPRPLYDHKWHGKYLETTENPLILPEWFDAAVDAHKKSKAFEPRGAIIAAYDPFDDGDDAASVGIRHGSIIKAIHSRDTGEIDECTDWATGIAIKAGADWFYWDGDGMGTGLKRQLALNFRGKAIRWEMFKGSLSGKAMDDAESQHESGLGEHDEARKQRQYKDVYLNNRARYYTDLSKRFHNTYRHIVKGEYIDPDLMISLDSDGIKDLPAVKAQVCRIPLVQRGDGLIQVMSKKEMKQKLKMPSPNDADVLMMSMKFPKLPAAGEPNSFEPDFEQ